MFDLHERRQRAWGDLRLVAKFVTDLAEGQSPARPETPKEEALLIELERFGPVCRLLVDALRDEGGVFDRFYAAERAPRSKYPFAPVGNDLDVLEFLAFHFRSPNDLTRDQIAHALTPGRDTRKLRLETLVREDLLIRVEDNTAEGSTRFSISLAGLGILRQFSRLPLVVAQSGISFEDEPYANRVARGCRIPHSYVECLEGLSKRSEVKVLSDRLNFETSTLVGLRLDMLRRLGLVSTSTRTGKIFYKRTDLGSEVLQQIKAIPIAPR